jgi:hypothetical protein
MKNTTYVITKTAERTGIRESLVEKVLRTFDEDFAEFINLKKAYSVMFPKVGRFSYRMTALDKYIEKQRYYKRYWQVRMQVGEMQGVMRTVEAAKVNIEKIDHNITASLKIKVDYLNNHVMYDRKGDYIRRTSTADPTRLVQYLDVSTVTLKDAAPHTIQKKGVRSLPDETRNYALPDAKIDHLLSYLQSVQVRSEGQDSQPEK